MTTTTLDRENQLKKNNAKTAKWLTMIVLGMFVFAFAQIQLYGLFCKAVGVNSLSSRQKIDDYAALINNKTLILSRGSTRGGPHKGGLEDWGTKN